MPIICNCQLVPQISQVGDKGSILAFGKMRLIYLQRWSAVGQTRPTSTRHVGCNSVEMVWVFLVYLYRHRQGALNVSTRTHSRSKQVLRGALACVNPRCLRKRLRSLCGTQRVAQLPRRTVCKLPPKLTTNSKQHAAQLVPSFWCPSKPYKKRLPF